MEDPMMTGDELRAHFLRYLEARGHTLIPSAPLVPENDPTVLFTTAGMHPLVPFLLGEAHPEGRRLTNAQKCLRTDDIDEVGDISHNTFFEMLGFWSLGDYWKADSLRWTLDWLTEALGLDHARLWVTIFAGDEQVPGDEEAAQVWRDLGVPEERIVRLGRADNWWGPVGETGPCGPDSELFYDTLREPCGPDCRPGCDCGKFVEIGNNVFLQFNRTAEGTYVPLAQRNVDVGLGLERLTAMHQGVPDSYGTDLFAPLMSHIAGIEGQPLSDPERHTRLRRIVADHVRAATFLIADGVTPANTERGYICRRLVRRAVRAGHELGVTGSFTAGLAQVVIERYGAVYPELVREREGILAALTREEERFRRTLARGLREFARVVEGLRRNGETVLSGEQIFHLFDTNGFPPELSAELAAEQGLAADLPGFRERFRAHQELSRQANQHKFAGGLADHSERVTRLHTATHLLQQALRDVLGDHVHQMGSNITAERLRFDFSHETRLTPDEIARVEARVNEQIARDLRVSVATMPLGEALASGALAFFGERYGDMVKVYSIGDYSREVCGGPHVAHTGGMGRFHILKVESIGHGTQRIRAKLVDQPEKATA
jgi:alanyl-tRNA synthetase